MELLHKLETIFSKVLKKTITLKKHYTANDIQDWTSFTHIQLIHEIEKQFNIKFSFQDILSFQNIEDIINKIKDKQL